MDANELTYRGNIPGLDVLRGFAILMVVACHAVPDYRQWSGLARDFVYLVAFGSAGVHLFYLLSGFLISGILFDTQDRPRYFQVFYVRRALRILPAYFLILAVLISADFVSWKFVLACVLFIANMAGAVGARTAEFGIFWSLAVEEQFYLAWPLVIRKFSLANIVRVILLVCIASPFVRYYAAAHSVDAYYKLWDNADYLMYGALVAALVRTKALNRQNVRMAYYVLYAAGILAVTITVCLHGPTIISTPQDAVWSAIGRLPFMLLFSAMLLHVLERNDGKRYRIFQPLVLLGYISYGLYLLHLLIFRLYDDAVRNFGLDYLGQYHSSIGALLLRGTVVAGVSIGIAYCSRRYFEEPFLRRKTLFAHASEATSLLQPIQSAARTSSD